MTKEDNIHPVVRLLVARMESHPEEFEFLEGETIKASTRIGRWEVALRDVRKWASPEELKLLSRAPLDALHRTAMDELLNGPERRAEEERLREEERKYFAAQSLMAQSQTQSLGQLYAQAQAQTQPPGQFYSLPSPPPRGAWLKGVLGIK